MKKLLSAAVIAALLFSCKSDTGKGKFTLTGEIKSAPDQQIYLEEVYFIKQAEVLDTGEIKDGKFTVSAVAAEEGIYRLRTSDGKTGYLFINDDAKINFSADIDKPEPAFHYFSSAANISFKKLMIHTDSLGFLIANKNRLLSEFEKAGVNETDSIFMGILNEYNALNAELIAYCAAYADTAKSPMVSLYAATLPFNEFAKLDTPLTLLAKRFPDHKGIRETLAHIKAEAVPQTQTTPNTPATIGNMAPELTMNDVNDKPFSLSQLKGKYVLVDFWASWCGPCRQENPNIVAAYNQFKDKNFTVLGVSLDKNKTAWVNAIKEDKLNWQHISDLKQWSSAAVGLYGFDGIPYNVLVDPQGKIIATGLRESALQKKLAEVLQ